MSDNFQKYKRTLSDIYRQAKDDSWTPQFATLLLLMGGILIATIFFNVAVFSFGHWLIALIVYLIEVLAPLFALYSHQRKIYEIVREKASEMESTHPGIYEAYEEWRAKMVSPS